MHTARNIGVFFALMKREMFLLKRNLKNYLIDGLVTGSIITIGVGYLLPALGMPPEMVAPLFINIFFNIFFMFGFSMAINMANELKFKGRIWYLMSLPVCPAWIFVSYICTFFIQATIIVIPLIAIGMFALNDYLASVQPDLVTFMLMYVISIIFLGLFMLLISIHYQYNWFLDNIWPRRLGIMYSFGATFFLWKQVQELIPWFAYLMLLNPMTYICEGMRSSFIGGDRFINVWVCFPALVLFSIAAAYALRSSVKKRLDPVW